MKQTLVQILALSVLTAALSLTAAAQQTVAPPQPPPAQRGRGAANPAKQEQQQLRNPNAVQPKANQQRRNNLTAKVVDTYVGGFQKNVGLSDEQTQKFSGDLGAYVRRQIVLAQNRTDAMKRLKELSDQHASDEEIQAQNDKLDLTEKQLRNSELKFYNDINPQLTPQQRANLRIYLNTTNERVRQAIKDSSQ